jgi:hypothetical protein
MIALPEIMDWFWFFMGLVTPGILWYALRSLPDWKAVIYAAGFFFASIVTSLAWASTAERGAIASLHWVIPAKSVLWLVITIGCLCGLVYEERGK